MVQAKGTGRLDDVTKLLRTQRRDSPWRLQDLSTGKPSLPFRGAREVGGPGCHFLKSPVSQSPLRNCRRRRRKKCDASTSRSNNFGVSRKRFKPSTPGSNNCYTQYLSMSFCRLFYCCGLTVLLTERFQCLPLVFVSGLPLQKRFHDTIVTQNLRDIYNSLPVCHDS